jgi:FHS family L-fucose permease-like MFS transporter
MFVASQLLAPNLMVTQFSEDIRDGKPEVAQYLITDEANLPAGAQLLPAEGDSKTRQFVLNDEFKTKVDLYPGKLPDFDSEVGALGSAATNAMKVLRETNPAEFEKIQQADLGYVRTPYVVVAAVVLVFLGIFAFSKMPAFQSEQKDAPFMEITARIFARPRFSLGVLAQGFNVGAQIMCWTFVVHYGMEYVGLTLAEAQNYNIVAMIIFLSSRWICTFLLRIFSPGQMLFCFALGGVLFSLGAVYLQGQTGLYSLVMVSSCLALMFPTIYGVALYGMEEEEAKLGSAYLIMSIVGGAVFAKIQGNLIDSVGVASSFWLPACCFAMIAIYGLLTFMVFEPQAKNEKVAAQ